MNRILCIVALLFAGVANATIISGDFRTEADLPYCCYDSGPLTYENLNASVGAGNELDSSDLLSNDSFWNGGLVFIDLDPSTNIITLDSQDDLDFEVFTASISNIMFDAGETITGLSWVSGNLTDIAITEILSFTANSITISYDVGNGNSVFDFTGTEAVFQIETQAGSVAVPAPASILLLSLGLFALVSRKRANS
ncbi:PEP-CTERM sorting domain-containing protein [Aliiglaciecola sp. 3_MG-2023]|uniref:PEP-CTERM sorting domain-containing protein n=1 Tax=Aliiglaciecola sp. 3_MG-2023 TaxID=3062644 RepID=UPI0026E42E96|nr:PEP-CTERM sorting domain-containing protein [Aliiglaciecola sp. 3_MG-2023]MDO6694944.1 PEP-CTERM sorting domain-containing protein [Aliiglaciecola sp. 3_MG-2023]